MARERIGEYLRVELLPRPSNRKTDIWRVFSNLDVELGHVKWLVRWRQYTFHPTPNTIFSRGCLLGLTTFLKDMNERWKNKKR